MQYCNNAFYCTIQCVVTILCVITRLTYNVKFPSFFYTSFHTLLSLMIHNARGKDHWQDVIWKKKKKMLNLSCLGLKNYETRKYDAISKTAYRKTGHRIVANLVITLNKYIHILSFYFQLVIPSKKEVSTTVDWDKILTISSVKKKKSCFEWQTTPHNSSLHIEENFRSPHAYALTKTKKGEEKKNIPWPSFPHIS